MQAQMMLLASPGGRVPREAEALRPRRLMPDDADARSSSTEMPDARLRLHMHRNRCQGQRMLHASQQLRRLAAEQSPTEVTGWESGKKAACYAVLGHARRKPTSGRCSSPTAAPRGSCPCGAGAAQSSVRSAPRRSAA